MDYNLSCVKVGNLDTNCYILKRDDLRGAVVIDPGDDPFIIKSTLLEMDATPDLILLTHGHFDHILALQEVRTSKTVVAIHEADAKYLTERDLYSSMIGNDPRPFPPADVLFTDKDRNVTLCGYDFEVIHTPGHTEGSVCYLFGDLLFTGDTLFRGGIGRTDLLGGNNEKMFASLKLLNSMPVDYAVYPGHEKCTTLSEEKENNPYLRFVKERA